jgi:hypothetical protein
MELSNLVGPSAELGVYLKKLIARYTGWNQRLPSLRFFPVNPVHPVNEEVSASPV